MCTTRISYRSSARMTFESVCVYVQWVGEKKKVAEPNEYSYGYACAQQVTSIHDGHGFRWRVEYTTERKKKKYT